MNQYHKNHKLNKAEIGMTDESISDWISGLQDTFSSSIYEKRYHNEQNQMWMISIKNVSHVPFLRVKKILKNYEIKS